MKIEFRETLYRYFFFMSGYLRRKLLFKFIGSSIKFKFGGVKRNSPYGFLNLNSTDGCFSNQLGA